MKNDTISRQMAIDELEHKKDKNAKGDISGFYNKIIQNDIDALMQLPPAQPEIIRCRDCRYWEREEPFTSIGRCGIWAYTHRKGSDYCSEAREVNE